MESALSPITFHTSPQIHKFTKNTRRTIKNKKFVSSNNSKQRMIRDLFRTSSCSSSESSAASESSNSTDQLNENTPVPTTTQFEVDGVLLSRDRQSGVGLEIHEKLWPSASKLANFVLEQHSSTLNNDNDDDDGEKEEEIHAHNVVRRMHEIQRKECALNKLKNMLRNTNEQNPLMVVELG